jgi:excisionase family DNA binding protein
MSKTLPLPRVAYSVTEIVVISGISRDRIYAAIRDGHLAAHRIGRRLLVTEAALRQFLAALPQTRGPRARRARIAAPSEKSEPAAIV